MNKCFAYIENIRNGIRSDSCECLSYQAFSKVQRLRGGCCMKNCSFYKESRDQIRSDSGIYVISDRQKNIQRRYERMKKMGVI